MEASEERHAKAYRALHDVTLPRVIAKIKGEGDTAEYATEGVNYPVGSVIHHDSLTPRDKERIKEHQLDHLLEPVSDAMAEAYPQHEVEPEFGVFVAEHEAEAFALEQYGHTVIPKDQELELLSADAQHAKEYQEQAKKAGLDRRPHLEAMHQRHRQRVPGELLLGTEQRTGVPHYRGAEGDEPHTEDGEHETRPAPPGQRSS
jgi:hypothetical protein